MTNETSFRILIRCKYSKELDTFARNNQALMKTQMAGTSLVRVAMTVKAALDGDAALKQMAEQSGLDYEQVLQDECKAALYGYIHDHPSSSEKQSTGMKKWVKITLIVCVTICLLVIIALFVWTIY